MTHQWRKTILPLLILSFSLLLDGALTGIFQTQLSGDFGYMIPRVIVLSFLMLSFYLPTSQLIILSLVFGLLFDSYYSGILGIYAAAFTIMVYGVSKVRKIFYPNMAMIGLVGVIAMSMVEFFVFLTYRLINLVNMDFSHFAARRLGPTLLLNGCLYLVLYYPLKKMIVSIEDDGK